MHDGKKGHKTPELELYLRGFLGFAGCIIERTYKNINTTPAARIRRVVLDQPARAADFTYSHASSIVISPAEEVMTAIIVALRL
jgi:hypothetical protein